MNATAINRIAIIGTGIMGAGMATLMIGNGIETILVGRSSKGCDSGRGEVVANLSELVQNGLMREEQIEFCLSRLQVTLDDHLIKDADVVFEAVQEKLDLKQSVYQRVEQICSPRTIIISMTSSISPDELFCLMAHPERMIVAHPWNPPHLVPCVEVVRNRVTSEETTIKTVSLLEQLGKKVIVLRKNIEGFIGNRIQHAMFREALNLIEQGIATPQEIDDTILYSFGQRYSRIGIMEYYDSVGLDLQLDVEKYLFPSLCNVAEPQKPLTDCLANGELGLKSGQGLFDWRIKDKDDFRRRKNQAYFQFVHWKIPDQT